MFSLQRRKYFDWILSAIAGTSLVILMFYASQAAGLTTTNLCSAAMFAATIPFSIASLLISKEAELYNKNELNSVDGGHASLFLLSVISFLIGFLLFIYSISGFLLIIFSAAGIISTGIYNKARKEIQN